MSETARSRHATSAHDECRLHRRIAPLRSAAFEEEQREHIAAELGVVDVIDAPQTNCE